VRRFLDAGVPVGLGSDIAGGHSLSLFRAVTDAVQCSKLRWRLLDRSLSPLSIEEAFYLATRGGGTFFGKVGAFEEGYAFDALVVDDAKERTTLCLTTRQRLERALYLEKGVEIVSKYVEGRKII
jgi:guanine deaminase